NICHNDCGGTDVKLPGIFEGMEIGDVVGLENRDPPNGNQFGNRPECDCEVGRITIGLQEFSIELNPTLI
ncbi:MAG: hypothetical protein WAM20_05855, partial [Acidobacteriaceae bacterium]